MIILASITVVIAILLTMHFRKIRNFFTTAKCVLLYNLAATFSLIKDNAARWRLQPLQLPERRGEVAVVTGGGRGIGHHVVTELLQAGMTVVVGVRNPAVCKVPGDHQPGHVEFLHLDTSLMKSVKKFASEVKRRHPQIQMLVNNAGVLFGEYEETEEGFEKKLATNYLGHFLLSQLLLPAMAPGGRMVHVSSCAHACIGIQLRDLNMKDHYMELGAYGHSKLAQLMFSHLLDRELLSRGSSVRSVAVHPGVVASGMSENWKHRAPFLIPLFLSEAEGAACVLRACQLPPKPGVLLHHDGEIFSTADSKDEEKQRRLFDLTCRLLEIQHFWSL